MPLSIKLGTSEELELDEIAQPKSNQFIITCSKNRAIQCDFEYILKPSGDYSTSDYSIYILKSASWCKENDIFQVYDRDLGERGRIGWIFPLQALLSREHDYSENDFFLNYAFVTFRKLLLKEVSLDTSVPDCQTELSLVDFYPSDSIILTLCNEKLLNIPDFRIECYLPALYSCGYYEYYHGDAFKIDTKDKEDRDIYKKIVPKRISKDLEDVPFLIHLFKKLLIYETHPLVKFHLLYQVIELLIERIYEKELDDVLDKAKEINRLELREKLLELSQNEKRRIKKLVDDYKVSITNSVEMKNCCNELLSKYSKTKDNAIDALYAVRSFIVHNYRELSNDDIILIKDVNSQFEEAIISILLSYSEERVQKDKGIIK